LGLLGLEGVTVYYYRSRFQFFKNAFRPFLVAFMFLRKIVAQQYPGLRIAAMSCNWQYSKKQVEKGFSMGEYRGK
jgi:hypothetical protein